MLSFVVVSERADHVKLLDACLAFFHVFDHLVLLIEIELVITADVEELLHRDLLSL